MDFVDFNGVMRQRKKCTTMALHMLNATHFALSPADRELIVAAAEELQALYQFAFKAENDLADSAWKQERSDRNVSGLIQMQGITETQVRDAVTQAIEAAAA